MKYKAIIRNMMLANRDIKGMTLMIDTWFQMGKIVESEKQELLTMIGVSDYIIIDLIDYIPTLYAMADEIDLGTTINLLFVYVDKNIITQTKADEIITACKAKQIS